MPDSAVIKKKIGEKYRIPIYRIVLVKVSETVACPITNPKEVAAQMKDLAHSDREKMICLYLNTKNRPIGRETVAMGTLNSSLAHPREIFKGAILRNAASIILVHNHPSGNPAPSCEDDALTKRLSSVGKLHGIQLLDHVIVCPGGSYFSYQEGNQALL